jgi:hypothetical protein
MKNVPNHGTLIISVEEVNGLHGSKGEGIRNEDLKTTNLLDSKSAVNAARWLLDTLAQQQLAATWFFVNPAVSEVCRQVVAAKLGHEVGLALTEIGNSRGDRAQLLQNLRQMLPLASAQGLELKTVSTSRLELTEHLDLLGKHGVHCIRPGFESCEWSGRRRVGWSTVAVLRFGIVRLPCTEVLTAPRWFEWLYRRGIARCMGYARNRAGYFHLALNLRMLSDSRYKNRAQRILQLMAQACTSQGWKNATMSAVAEAVTSRSSSVAARSILRAA